MKKITEKGLVILQPTINLKPEKIKRYKEYFAKDIENGLLIIPKWFNVIVVPKGVEVRTEEEDDSRNKDT